MHNAPTIAYIGIGANLGDARATVEDAIARPAALPQTELLRCSSLYRTAPIDSSGDDYINAVAQLATTLTAGACCRPCRRSNCSTAASVPIATRRARSIWMCCCMDRTASTAALTVPHPRMTSAPSCWRPAGDRCRRADPGLGAAAPLLAAITDQPISKL
jgi:2-amino-4-hydroxy-6-hydroxymethyldihydropteridine diphosphokinase